MRRAGAATRRARRRGTTTATRPVPAHRPLGLDLGRHQRRLLQRRARRGLRGARPASSRPASPARARTLAADERRDQAGSERRARRRPVGGDQQQPRRAGLRRARRAAPRRRRRPRSIAAAERDLVDLRLQADGVDAVHLALLQRPVARHEAARLGLDRLDRLGLRGARLRVDAARPAPGRPPGGWRRRAPARARPRALPPTTGACPVTMRTAGLAAVGASAGAGGGRRRRRRRGRAPARTPRRAAATTDRDAEQRASSLHLANVDQHQRRARACRPAARVAGRAPAAPSLSTLRVGARSSAAASPDPVDGGADAHVAASRPWPSAPRQAHALATASAAPAATAAVAASPASRRSGARRARRRRRSTGTGCRRRARGRARARSPGPSACCPPPSGSAASAARSLASRGGLRAPLGARARQIDAGHAQIGGRARRRRQRPRLPVDVDARRVASAGSESRRARRGRARRTAAPRGSADAHGRQRPRCAARYSHSIVAGGFDEMS